MLTVRNWNVSRAIGEHACSSCQRLVSSVFHMCQQKKRPDKDNREQTLVSRHTPSRSRPLTVSSCLAFLQSTWPTGVTLTKVVIAAASARMARTTSNARWTPANASILPSLASARVGGTALYSTIFKCIRFATRAFLDERHGWERGTDQRHTLPGLSG